MKAVEIKILTHTSTKTERVVTNMLLLKVFKEKQQRKRLVEPFTSPDVKQRNDYKFDAFKIAKSMIKTNQDMIGEQCIRKYGGVSSVSDEDAKIVQESHHEKHGHGQRVNQSRTWLERVNQ